jgi:hypothetical protein
MCGMHGLVVLLHVLGAFAFVAAHGVSMFAAFRLQGERDRSRQATLLELSQMGVGASYVGLLLLLVAGILAGFMGNHWDRGWIWAALGTLVAVAIAMYAVATPFYGRMRAAAGVGGMGRSADQFKPPATDADLDALPGSNRPMLLATIGGIGLVVIVWLMMLKPF